MNVKGSVSSLFFLGDVWLPRAVRACGVCPGDVVFNLESPITQANQRMPGKINLKAEGNHILETFGRVPIAVSLANNHIMDYGDQGYQDTVASLERAGIGYYGAGTFADNGGNPLLVECGGVNVALLGYAAADSSPILANGNGLGAMPADLDRMIADIRRAREQGARRVVISLHWGAEHVYLPKREAIDTAHALIDAGADLIIGHHAHRIQPYEVYKGKHIFYGLGNCIFPEVPKGGIPREGAQAVKPARPRLFRRRNRSLGVEFESETASVHVSVLESDDRELHATARNASGYLMDFSSMCDYNRRFKRAYAFGKLKAALAGYLARPYLPRPRHLATLLSLVFRREYREYK